MTEEKEMVKQTILRLIKSVESESAFAGTEMDKLNAVSNAANALAALYSS